MPETPSAAGVVPLDVFRSLMSEFPTGVAVVTSLDHDGEPRGMTCSALCSVTGTPPTLLVCLRRESPTLDAVIRCGRFAVNLLHSDAQHVAELFGSPVKTRRFDMVDWSMGRCGPHIAEHAHAIADCRVTSTGDGGSHVVVFGEVSDVTLHRGRVPLLYGRRRYNVWFEQAARQTALCPGDASPSD
ncbi:NADH-FMN oxidoreductase RutF, flavin reductase (DIM6/NTAB) family [Streptomyces sp. Ncost-T6T-1]|uniref:flavin reductase family protein n=1 Tax=Streptomyces sp. Ncost-T6T-1 TaxID=1100828 RepID=UPI0008055CD7|nr:flavin reductase family protein [Streptomyces sp. Ncost-T6T-1]SBU91176.1 NADH-FMN oxidoreductase RutF, flavin reductase (DIM6/NTAB) family [Streptomyces sp. Ncost-T6T-1]